MTTLPGSKLKLTHSNGKLTIRFSEEFLLNENISSKHGNWLLYLPNLIDKLSGGKRALKLDRDSKIVVRDDPMSLETIVTFSPSPALSESYLKHIKDRSKRRWAKYRVDRRRA